VGVGKGIERVEGDRESYVVGVVVTGLQLDGKELIKVVDVDGGDLDREEIWFDDEDGEIN
jgi:endonuclease V-like protein UPF0215 family